MDTQLDKTHWNCTIVIFRIAQHIAFKADASDEIVFSPCHTVQLSSGRRPHQSQTGCQQSCPSRAA